MSPSMPFTAHQVFHAGTMMKRFRFFVIDSMGRIDRCLERDCRDDADALRFANQQADAASVEVWLESRMIGKLHLSPAD